jgi:hypothetical protein
MELPRGKTLIAIGQAFDANDRWRFRASVAQPAFPQ